MKMTMNLALLALTLVGCASGISLGPTDQRRIGEDPPLRSRAQRSVGEAIYQTYNYRQVMEARLEEPLAIKGSGARATISAGSPLDQFRDRSDIVYCTKEPALRVGLFGGGPPSYYVCLADQNDNGSFDSWGLPGGDWVALNSEAPFSTEEASGEIAGGFKYELVYQGISGNVVSLLYREYADNLARSAFQQDLSYTLAPSGPSEVSFRGTRIRIYTADNNSIDYEVLSGLDEGDG